MHEENHESGEADRPFGSGCKRGRPAGTVVRHARPIRTLEVLVTERLVAGANVLKAQMLKREPLRGE
jgi:hypothetical protein